MDISVIKIKADGIVDLKFNQPLIPPQFDEPKQAERGRMLLSLDELDVARDVVDVKFVSKNGEESDKFEYFLSIEEWTELNLKIFVNFTNPGAVSNG